MKASQPLSPKIPRSGIATRNLNNFRSRRMRPCLVSTPNMGTDRTHEPLAYTFWNRFCDDPQLIKACRAAARLGPMSELGPGAEVDGRASPIVCYPCTQLTGGTHGTFDPCIADGLILRRRVLVVAAQDGDRDGPIWSRKQFDPGPGRHY